MNRNIEEVFAHPQMPKVKKNWDIIIEKEIIPDRCAEYIGELFEDCRKDNDVMKCNFAGPPIMKDEMRTAIREI